MFKNMARLRYTLQDKQYSREETSSWDVAKRIETERRRSVVKENATPAMSTMSQFSNEDLERIFLDGCSLARL